MCKVSDAQPKAGKKRGKVQTLLRMDHQIKPPLMMQEGKVDHTVENPPLDNVVEQKCKVFKMGGINVSFPPGKTPFPSQMMVMSKMILAMKNGKNALLESPTGTGKTLSLLCAVLAWQNNIVRSQTMSTVSSTEQVSTDGPVPMECMAWRGTASLRGRENECAASVTLQYEEGDTMANGMKTKKSVGTRFDISSGEKGCRRTPGEVKEERIEASSLQNLEMKQPLPEISHTEVPTTYFCTRTHSQLMQVVKELRSCKDFLFVEQEEKKFPEGNNAGTSDGLPKRMYKSFSMTMLGSRKQYCINSHALNHIGGVDEGCKELCDGKLDEGRKCGYRGRSSLLRSNLPTVWDIEDAVVEGKKLAGCPYYTSREKQQLAQLILCPYNYVLDPGIRGSLGIDLSGAVVIIDEAHNIADVCRDGASCRISLFSITQTVQVLEREFTHPKKHRLHNEYTNMKEFLDTLRRWMVQQASSNKLKKDNFTDRWHMELSGSDALDVFWNDLKLTGSRIASVRENLEIIKDVSHEYKVAGEPLPELGGKSLSLIGGILNTIKYFYSKAINGGQKLNHTRSNEEHFRVVIMKEIEKTEYETYLAIWCMSPHLVFQDVSRISSSIILTSGTLSPMDSFATELGSDFPIRIEAPHVINVRKQCLVMSINSMGDIGLDGRYKNQQEEKYQDAIGEAVHCYSNCLRGGILVFLSSYSLMDKLVNRWETTGCLASIQRLKTFGMEPRGSGKEVNLVLDRHYRAVEQSRKGLDAAAAPAAVDTCCPARAEQNNFRHDGSGWNQIKRRRRKWNSETSDSEQQPIFAQTGAVLLAVCRGKVSEGLDFSDDYARLTCIVGIPYSSRADIKLKLKQQYQDLVAQKDQQHINGQKWYTQQAFRAVNQAMGRCIRHRHDFGAICLLDPRYSQKHNISPLSKWIRGQIRMDHTVESSLDLILGFFHELIKLEQSVQLPIKSHDGQLEAIAQQKAVAVAAAAATAGAIPVTKRTEDKVVESESVVM